MCQGQRERQGITGPLMSLGHKHQCKGADREGSGSAKKVAHSEAVPFLVILLGSDRSSGSHSVCVCVCVSVCVSVCDKFKFFIQSS